LGDGHRPGPSSDSTRMRRALFSAFCISTPYSLLSSLWRQRPHR
jgi:hypothetical protein